MRRAARAPRVGSATRRGGGATASRKGRKVRPARSQSPPASAHLSLFCGWLPGSALRGPTRTRGANLPVEPALRWLPRRPLPRCFRALPRSSVPARCGATSPRPAPIFARPQAPSEAQFTALSFSATPRGLPRSLESCVSGETRGRPVFRVQSAWQSHPRLCCLAIVPHATSEYLNPGSLACQDHPTFLKVTVLSRVPVPFKV